MMLPTVKKKSALMSSGKLIALAMVGVLMSACAQPVYRVKPSTETPPPQTQLFFYPTQGQTQAQQDRDRYECHLWAVKNSGYDPGESPIAPHQKVEVVTEPAPGSNVAAGAVGGAVVGSILSGPRQHGRGMVFGAFTGALLGAAADQAQQQRKQQLQGQYDASYAKQYAQAERESRNYQRAMTACLEGRGYSVR